MKPPQRRASARLFLYGTRAVALLTLAVLTLGATAVHAGERLIWNFNADWRFNKADTPKAANKAFKDAKWQLVSAPHTFNDTDTFDDFSLSSHRGEQNQWSGRTWYRKTFRLPKDVRGRKVFIEFEAVRQIAEVYLNGHLLGVSKTGFTPFGFDLTPHLVFDRPNVLAVMCDNRFVKDPEPAPRSPTVGRTNATSNLHQNERALNERIPESLDELQADQIPWNNPHWHPAHGGIYRNVRLYVTDPLHITLPLFSFLETAGPYVYATDISSDSALVNVEIPVRNDRAKTENVLVRAAVIDARGNTVLTLTSEPQSIATQQTAAFKVSGQIIAPLPWEPAHPHLYRVVCSLVTGGAVVDTSEVPLGIRVAQWDPEGPLKLNGRAVKLHGWGQKPTDEWPAVGAAHPDWMHHLTLQLMRDAGGNFVRWGHCAGGPASIEAGDRLGIIADQPGVDGESDTRGAAWKLRVQAFRDTVIYFRNNPSILIWEGGNQKLTREHGAEMRAIMDRYDPHGGRAYAHRRADQITAEFMDVGIGTEGGREIARLAVVEGEYNREESPRRVWDDKSPPNFGYPEAAGQTYQLTSEQFAVNQLVQHWNKKMAPAEHAGGANWIFSDSTSGGRVAVEVARTSGEVDGMRLPKEAYYACAAAFRAIANPDAAPTVHIIGHWSYPADTRKTVHVVSSAAEVELRINNRAVARAKPVDRFLFSFPDIAWEPGTVTAVAYSAEGRALATQTKRTVGAPVALRLSALTSPGGLRADGSDVVLIDIEAVDAFGERCPTFQQRVNFELRGPGVWRGGYNSGKPGSINHPFLDLDAGINRVAVRATRSSGTIVLRATAEGLPPKEIEIEALPAAIREGVAATLPVMPEPMFAVNQETTRPFIGDLAAVAARLSKSTQERRIGRFIRTFSYSGPSSPIVHVDTHVRDGKNAYVDIDSPFSGLPEQLTGADWIKAGNRDSLYSAVDLIEMAVPARATVSIAHDDGLVRPDWLTGQFRATEQRITVLGRPMTIFERTAAADESLTLGANTETRDVRDANMYVVFVK